MARLFENSACPICKRRLKDTPSLSFFCTSGTFFEPEDPLFPYCDAAMHLDCYENWPHRARFALAHFDHWIPPFVVFIDWEIGYALHVADFPHNTIHINPLESGIPTFIDLRQYDDFIADPDMFFKDWHSLEQVTIKRIFPNLRQRFPDQKTLLEGTKKRTYVGFIPPRSSFTDESLREIKFHKIT